MAAVIAGAVRLAIGSFGGALSNVHVTDLGAEVLKQALNRAGVEAGAIQEIIMGNVVQAGAGMNSTRQAAIKAGIGRDIPSYTVNKVCGSPEASESLFVAAHRGRCREHDCHGTMCHRRHRPGF